jgi:hypothetical protein
MSANGRPHLSARELVVVLGAQALVDAGVASWESPWRPRNPRVFALCAHDRTTFWRNSGGRPICGICHPPVGCNVTAEDGAS